MKFIFIVVLCVLASSLAAVLGSSPTYSVAVIGGGVSGLTAAHELSERGFDVKVYERQDVFGGKARSYNIKGTGTGSRKDLPGEHGFRIFWNYYLNIFQTMKRIPYNTSISTYDYMRKIHANALLTEAGPDIYIDFGPKNMIEWLNEIRNITTEFGFLSKQEMDFAISRMEIMMTTCNERMREEFEHFSFGQFIGVQYRSRNFTKFWLDLFHLGGFTPEKAGLGPTVNYVQGLNSPWDVNDAVRVLQRPTNEAWIDPWVSYMSSNDGVVFSSNKTAKSFTCSSNAITSVTVLDTTTNQTTIVKADFYVFAVPVNNMVQIMKNSNDCGGKLSHLLSSISQLPTTWMGGMQYFLHKDVPISDGFVLYLDSPWNLTSVQFRQWWPGYNWNNVGDGSVQGVISAIISNFTNPGILFNKTAMDCSVDEIKKEVWAQMKAHLNRKGDILDDNNIAGFSLDTSLQVYDNILHNEEPLFYAPPNSWAISPDSTTPLLNLFLCGDYVKAFSRVTPSTMEAANESAKRAVNAILKTVKSTKAPCDILAPPRNPDFEPLRLQDLARFTEGLPHVNCQSKGCVATS